MAFNALSALPRFTMMEAVQAGREARNRNALAGLQMQQKRAELSHQVIQDLAQGVMASDDPARDYPRALNYIAQTYGPEHVANLPRQWGPDAEMLTRMAARPEDELTALQRNISMLPEADRIPALRRHFGLDAKAGEPGFTNVGGTLLRTDPNAGTAEPVYTAPEKPDHPAGVDEYLFAVERDGFTGTYQDWLRQKKGPPKRDIRNDPAGVPRYVDTAEPVFPGVEPPPTKPSALDQKIDRLMGAGLDRNTATNIATGRYAVSRDPITGQAQILDKATGQPVGEAPPGVAGAGSPELASSASEQPAGLYNQTEKGTGAISSFKEMSSNTLGQLPGGTGDLFSFPETVEARQNFRNATSDLIRALAVNTRYPVAEQNRLREEFGVEPNILEDPQAMQDRMRSIDRYLRGLLDDERNIAGNERMPPDMRADALRKSQAIGRYLRLLGVPQEDQQPQGGWQDTGSIPHPRSEREVEALPSGTVFIAPDGSRRVKP